MADPLEELFGPVKTPEAAPPSPQAAGPDPLEQMFGPAKGVAPPPSASPPRPGLLANDPADSDRVDIAKNIGTGAVKGAAGTLLDLPNMAVEYLSPVGAGKKLLAAGAGALERRYSTDETRALKGAADTLAARTGLGPSTEDVLGVTGEYVPETTAGKIGQKAVEGLTGAAVLPLGATSSVGKFAANLAGGAASGAAGGTALEVAKGQTDNKMIQAAAELAGNVATPLAGGALAKVAKPATDIVTGALARRTEAGRRAQAGADLRAMVSGDPEEVARRAAAAEEFVPGSKRMSGEATRDAGLESYDRAKRTANETYAQRFKATIDANEAARHNYIAGLSDGDPMAVRNSVRSTFDDLNRLHDLIEENVGSTARADADAVGVGRRAEEVGPDMRSALDAAHEAARARASALYQALERRGLRMEVSPILKDIRRLYTRLTPEEAAGILKSENTIRRLIAKYQDVMPLKNVRGLSALVTDAMATERAANAGQKTAAWNRLRAVKASIENGISDAALTQAERDAQEVARGRMQEQDSLAAILRGLETDLGAEVGALGRAEGSGGLAATARAEPGLAAGDGAAGAAGAGLGKAPPVRYLPAANRPTRPRPADPLPANLTDRDRADLKDANAQWGAQARTFQKGSVGEALKRDGRGDFTRVDAAVPSLFFRPGETGGARMDQFLKASGPQGEAMARDYAVERMWDAVTNKSTGEINPDKLAKWRANHREALSRIPGLDDQLSSVENAQRAVAEAAAARKDAVTTFQKTTAGKLLGVEDPDALRRTVGTALASRQGAAEMRQLVNTVRGDPDALQGLQRAVLDHVHDARNVAGANYRNYLRQHRAALETVFTPDQMKALDAIDLDIGARQAALNGQQIPGGPNTAKDFIAAQAQRQPGGRPSILGIFTGIYASTLGFGVGPVTATKVAASGALAEYGRQKIQQLKTLGYDGVDKLIDDAMFEPKLLAELLRTAPPNPKPLMDRVVSALKVRALQGGLPNPEQDDEPGPWRPRITPERKN